MKSKFFIPAVVAMVVILVVVIPVIRTSTQAPATSTRVSTATYTVTPTAMATETKTPVPTLLPNTSSKLQSRFINCVNNTQVPGYAPCDWDTLVSNAKNAAKKLSNNLAAEEVAKCNDADVKYEGLSDEGVMFYCDPIVASPNGIIDWLIDLETLFSQEY